LSDEILAFAGRKTNAEVIRDCATLGYLLADWDTIDLTYGYGRFWALWRPDPEHFSRGDLNPNKSPDYPDGLNATDTKLPSRSWDAVVIDPPYKFNGTSGQGGPASSDESYGVDGDYVTPSQRLGLMTAMMVEGHRILRPNGFMLYKCQAQVVSGKVIWQDRIMAERAEGLGMRHVDTLYVEGHRPQPSGRRQVHARQNYSTMLILKKGRS